MMLARCVIVAVLSLVCCAAVGVAAGAAEARRHGLTIELGVGAGSIQVANLLRDSGSTVDIGFEPHAIGIGGFITDRVALLYRWSSTYYFATNAQGETAQGVLGTHAPHVQVWLGERWMVGGGVGAAFFGNVLGRDDADPDIAVGLALAGRVGYAFALLGPDGALKVTLKVLAGLFADGAAVGQTLNLNYQWY